MIQIDTGIVMPEDRTKYPFRDMQDGDSILFTDKKQAESARVASLRFVRMHAPKWQFSLRRVSDGWRLWRTR